MDDAHLKRALKASLFVAPANFLYVVDIRQHASCPMGDFDSHWCQEHPCPRPLHKARFESAFQLLELKAKGRLSDVACLSSTAETQRVGDRDQVSKLL